MSAAKPRSSLKKGSGAPDDNRRVSFASPLLSEKQDSPAHRKDLPITKIVKTNRPVVKKSKPAEELVDIISLVNHHSDVIEEIFEMESKFGKESAMTKNLTIDMTNFIEFIATLSSDSTKVESQLEEQSARVVNLETNISDLISQASSVCAKYESRIDARTQYSNYLLDLQKAFNAINCVKIDNPEDSHIDYDPLLKLVDQLEVCIDKF